MIFKRITLNNAGPFLGNWSVDLREGATVVVGAYEGAGERSNRSGKSFFAVDAPMYALFGQFRGKTDEFAHRLVRGKDDAWVEIEVATSNGGSHLIRQGRTTGGDPIRELDGSSVKRDDLNNYVVHDMLGLTLDEWQLTNLFVQSQMHGFMALSAADKRRVISPWFKTDRWIPRAELARERLGQARADLRAVEVGLQNLAEQTETPAVMPDDLELAAKRRDGAAAELARIEAELARLEESRRERDDRFKKFEQSRQGMKRLEREVDEERQNAELELRGAELAVASAERDLEAARDRKKWMVTLENDLASLGEIKDAAEGAKLALRDAKEKIKVNEERREELLSKYNELKRSRTGICPLLREPCDRIAPDGAVLEQIVAEGKEHRAAIELLTESLGGLEWKADMSASDLKTVLERERELVRLRSQPTVEQVSREAAQARARLERAEKALRMCKHARTELAKALRVVRKRYQELETEHLEFENREQETQDLTESQLVAKRALNAADATLAEYKAKVVEQERAAARVTELQAERARLQALIENLAFASYAFGATGIPSREVENAFGEAEASMNDVLTVVNTPLRVRFTPLRELKEWEPACLGCGTRFEKGERSHTCKECGAPRRKKRRDELRMEVLDGDNVSSFELDSGGGKVLLSLGVRLGLAKLPGSVRMATCQHLIIDEPDGALDAPNRAALHGLINNRLTELGMRQALIITHADVKDEFGQVVEVRRFEDEDRSEVLNA